MILGMMEKIAFALNILAVLIGLAGVTGLIRRLTESDYDRVIRETIRDEGVWWSDYNT